MNVDRAALQAGAAALRAVGQDKHAATLERIDRQYARMEDPCTSAEEYTNRIFELWGPL